MWSRLGSRFAVFDPHARGEDGGLELHGTSIVACYDTLGMAYEHVTNLVYSLHGDDDVPNQTFEVTGVKAFLLDQVSVDESVVDLESETLAVVGVEHVASDSGSMVCDQVSVEDSVLNVESETLADVVEHVANDSESMFWDQVFDENPINLELETIATTSNDESGVCLVSETSATPVTFKSLTLADKRRICFKLDIVPSLSPEDVVLDSKELEQPVPCTTTDINSDGNCFFSALSHVFTGVPTYHKNIRRAVINNIKQNPDVP